MGQIEKGFIVALLFIGMGASFNLGYSSAKLKSDMKGCTTHAPAPDGSNQATN